MFLALTLTVGKDEALLFVAVIGSGVPLLSFVGSLVAGRIRHRVADSSLAASLAAHLENVKWQPKAITEARDMALENRRELSALTKEVGRLCECAVENNRQIGILIGEVGILKERGSPN